MNTFPHTIHAPDDKTFRDEKSDEAVLIESMASGYPLMNKLFTFDAITFTRDLRFVSQTNKLTIMAFYEANKDVPFYWTNEQDDIQYEVGFVSKPECTSDGEKEVWRITYKVRQTSSNTVP